MIQNLHAKASTKNKKLLMSLIVVMGLMMCFTLAGCGESEDTPADQAEPFDITKAEDSPEFVGELEQAADADQLFIVAGIGKTTAYVSMHQKDEEGNWKQIMTTLAPCPIARSASPRAAEVLPLPVPV